MTETPARKPRPRRTFSAFGDVRRMPSEYEIVTHAQNWTLRQNRAAAFEQNPSSAPNLWFLTYRDNTPLKATDWDAFRDPDALTYRAYVNLQSDAETRVGGVLEAHADAGLTMETARWRDTINVDDLWEGDMTAVTVDGETVLLVNVDRTVRAYSNRCPHQASALDEGDLDGDTLTCAKHLWEFNAVTGHGINPDDAQLKSFACRVGDDGTIYVDIGR